MNRIHRTRLPDTRLKRTVLFSLAATILLAVLVLLRLDRLRPPSGGSPNGILDSTEAVETLHLSGPYPDRVAIPEQPPVNLETPAPSIHQPSLAIVLDDFGNNWNSDVVQESLHFDGPLTIAVIPGLWASERIADTAHAAGKEVIAHIPMQPVGGNVHLEKRYLHSSMTPVEVDRFLDRAVDKVPWAIGMNNHMGSLATQDSLLMGRVAAWCGRHGWLILDSITHPATVLYREARRNGIPAAQRDFFLDHVTRERTIRKQLAKAVAVARKRNGPVVVIGHPHAATWAVLKTELPRLQQEGIQLLPLSRVVQ